MTSVGIKACNCCYFYVKEKFDLAFILTEVDWVVTSPCPAEPVAPVREINEADAAWATSERDFAFQRMSYDLEPRKWVTANKKCMAVIKNMIDLQLWAQSQSVTPSPSTSIE